MRNFYQKNKEPKELCKALKSLSLLFKITPVIQVSPKSGEKFPLTKRNSFKNFYSNLALNLLNKLPM